MQDRVCHIRPACHISGTDEKCCHDRSRPEDPSRKCTIEEFSEYKEQNEGITGKSEGPSPTLHFKQMLKIRFTDRIHCLFDGIYVFFKCVFINIFIVCKTGMLGVLGSFAHGCPLIIIIIIYKNV